MALRNTARAAPATVLVREPDEGWTMPLDGRSRAVAIETRGAGEAFELEDISLSRVRLEGFDAPCQVERLEDIPTPFALVRGERRRGDRVVWLLFELVRDEANEANEANDASGASKTKKSPTTGGRSRR